MSPVSARAPDPDPEEIRTGTLFTNGTINIDNKWLSSNMSNKP